ncbi:MAG: alginate export family protein [Verrucomicrobiae bacterium]|nr:alginate export family protein [Verrucomicrobiae bacterium]
MKPNLKTLSAGALVLAALNEARAQYTPPPPPAPFQGFINEALRARDPYANQWDFGGELRGRYEVKDGFAIQGTAGSVDFRNHGVRVNNDYYLLRLRFHAGYTDKWWSAYVEPQSSIEKSDLRAAYANVPAVAGTTKFVGNGPESDTIDLHQAYVTLGNHKEFPLSLKAGRQEMSYGDERLIGGFGWNNIGRSFDAAKVRWQTEWFAADFFSGWPVVPQDQTFDDSNTKDTLSGVYATTLKVPKTIVEGYFLARNSQRGAINEFASPQFPQPTARDIYTVGGRLKSKPGELGNIDYTVEGAYQFGDFAATATSGRLRQDAFMFTALAGYTFADLWATPRLGAEFDYGSGDDNSKDGVHGTFDNLFPTNHKFYGSMDLVSLQNIQDVGVNVTLKPVSRLSVALMGNIFWLANKNDSFYNVGGAPRATGGYSVNPGYGNFVGSELTSIVGYALTRNSVLETGYGHFFAASYIDKSVAGVGGSRDADWFYVQTTLKF